MSVALVVGGATGIGAQAVRALRDRGDDVILVDINEHAGVALCEEPARGRATFVLEDVSVVDGATRSVDAALAWADGRLDTVFFNAGRLDARPLAQWTPELWDNALALNLRAPFFVVQRAAAALVASTVGRVIITASTGAFRGHAGMPAYHASKAGVIGLVRVLADELGPDGVTVNALCPGWIETPFNDTYWQHQADAVAMASALDSTIPLRRQGTPADVTGTVLFLASEASQYITGTSIVIDGGYTAV